MGTLISLRESLLLSPEVWGQYYRDHINSGLLEIYSLLGTSNMDVRRAEGVEIELTDGKKILDFSSALGIVGIGHNHPRIIAAEKMCHDLKLIDALKMGPSRLQAVLAFNLAQMLPKQLEVAFFAVSGAESVEGALKLCERIQRPLKQMVLTVEGGYHGKTHGALSVTDIEDFRDGYIMGMPSKLVRAIPFGDTDLLRREIESSIRSDGSNPYMAIILEPIQGQGVRVAPAEYLEEVVAICRRNNILVIFDEIKVGIGRTGSFCSFMKTKAIPDVVLLSKALGGGKRAISAFVTSKECFERAYGDRRRAGLHTTTFGGLGESCAVAIETLNVLSEENLMDAAVEKGNYFRTKLDDLMGKHQGAIKEIRGVGLMIGIQFNFKGLKLIQHIGSRTEKVIGSIVIAAIVREMYEKHNILTYFTESDLDVLHVMPPLTVRKDHIDSFCSALDTILAQGIARLGAKFIRKALPQLVTKHS